jgi:hypothetical protein
MAYTICTHIRTDTHTYTHTLTHTHSHTQTGYRGEGVLQAYTLKRVCMGRYSVKRDLVQCQKRPSIVSKESWRVCVGRAAATPWDPYQGCSQGVGVCVYVCVCVCMCVCLCVCVCVCCMCVWENEWVYDSAVSFKSYIFFISFSLFWGEVDVTHRCDGLGFANVLLTCCLIDISLTLHSLSLSLSLSLTHTHTHITLFLSHSHDTLSLAPILCLRRY